MALLFQRLARNFVKNGYFPTDAETIKRVLFALKPPEEGVARILDPCCGEGTALAECQHALGTDHTESFGIEYDKERAWHAKNLLNQCIHGDIQECSLGQRQFGLLWLNPPYGDLVSDKAQLQSSTSKGRARLEKQFYRWTFGSLQYGGVLVFIIPSYSLDQELMAWIAQRFSQVRVFRAPEQQFKQVVLFGIRKRTINASMARQTRQHLTMLMDDDESINELPDSKFSHPYGIPSGQPVAKFQKLSMDRAQLQSIISEKRGLWDQLEMTFKSEGQSHRRPLRQLSDWHLALALAAGQVSGVVRSSDGRTLVIKGDTYKEKMVKITQEEQGDGNVREVKTAIDKFVPVIRALDFTIGSPTFGGVLTIR